MEKWVFIFLAMCHLFEAIIAYHAAERCGKDPKEYFVKGLFLGAFFLVPLLREPVVEEPASRKDKGVLTQPSHVISHRAHASA